MRTTLSAAIFAFLTLVAAEAEQVVISEIMYHPVGTQPEFVELWNITKTPIDFAKWKFTDGVAFELPDFSAATAQATFFKPGERILVSAVDPATLRAAYTIPAAVRVFGPWSGSLNNGGETITLSDKNGVVVSSVKYGNGGLWPKAADGTGHSLVLRSENNRIDDFRNWLAREHLLHRDDELRWLCGGSGLRRSDHDAHRSLLSDRQAHASIGGESRSALVACSSLTAEVQSTNAQPFVERCR